MAGQGVVQPWHAARRPWNQRPGPRRQSCEAAFAAQQQAWEDPDPAYFIFTLTPQVQLARPRLPSPNPRT